MAIIINPAASKSGVFVRSFYEHFTDNLQTAGAGLNWASDHIWCSLMTANLLGGGGWPANGEWNAVRADALGSGPADYGYPGDANTGAAYAPGFSAFGGAPFGADSVPGGYDSVYPTGAPHYRNDSNVSSGGLGEVIDLGGLGNGTYRPGGQPINIPTAPAGFGTQTTLSCAIDRVTDTLELRFGITAGGGASGMTSWPQLGLVGDPGHEATFNGAAGAVIWNSSHSALQPLMFLNFGEVLSVANGTFGILWGTKSIFHLKVSTRV